MQRICKISFRFIYIFFFFLIDENLKSSSFIFVGIPTSIQVWNLFHKWLLARCQVTFSNKQVLGYIKALLTPSLGGLVCAKIIIIKYVNIFKKIAHYFFLIFGQIIHLRVPNFLDGDCAKYSYRLIVSNFRNDICNDFINLLLTFGYE